MGDILIYLKDQATHDHLIRKVLMCLHQHGFYAKLKKCEFDKTFVELYGFILLADDEIQMDTQNVVVVCSWAKPWNISDI